MNQNDGISTIQCNFCSGMAFDHEGRASPLAVTRDPVRRSRSITASVPTTQTGQHKPGVYIENTLGQGSAWRATSPTRPPIRPLSHGRTCTPPATTDGNEPNRLAEASDFVVSSPNRSAITNGNSFQILHEMAFPSLCVTSPSTRCSASSNA